MSETITADETDNQYSDKLQIVLLGAPGSGKGTQGEIISNKYHLPKISTGDILREEIAGQTELGKQVKPILDAGQLVQDDLIIKLVKKRLSLSDCKNGFILDGFPRTLAQAQMLKDSGININVVVLINVQEDEIIKRMSGRRVHLKSGRTYNIISNPPKVPGKDDVTGEPLIQRDDDKEETVRARLKNYNTMTAPLIDWYKSQVKDTNLRFITIDSGTLPITEVSEKILQELNLIEVPAPSETEE